jgi:hypothetical protein
MKKFTATTNAWLYDICFGPQDLLHATAKNVVGMVSYGDTRSDGYTLVGTAKITLELCSEDQMVVNKVASLRKEITKTRADAELKAKHLEKQVQQLLAITNEVKS